MALSDLDYIVAARSDAVKTAIAEGVSAAIVAGAFGGVTDAFAVVVRTENVSAVASRRLQSQRLTATATAALALVSCGMASETALNALVADASTRAADFGSSLTLLLRGSAIAPELALITAILLVSKGAVDAGESNSADLLRAQTVIAATSSSTGVLALVLAVIAGRYIFLRRRAAIDAAILASASTDNLAASNNPLWGDKAMGLRAADLASSMSVSGVDIVLTSTRAGHGAALRSRRTWHSAEASADSPRDVHPTRVAVEALARPPSGDRRVFTPERLNGLRFETLRGFRSPAAVPRARETASPRMSRDNLEPTLESALGHLEGEEVECEL